MKTAESILEKALLQIADKQSSLHSDIDPAMLSAMQQYAQQYIDQHEAQYQLNLSMWETNTAMGKRLLRYEQALWEIQQHSDSGSSSQSVLDMKYTAANALSLPCDFPQPYSEAEVFAIIDRVNDDTVEMWARASRKRYLVCYNRSKAI